MYRLRQVSKSVLYSLVLVKALILKGPTDTKTSDRRTEILNNLLGGEGGGVFRRSRPFYQSVSLEIKPI